MILGHESNGTAVEVNPFEAQLLYESHNALLAPVHAPARPLYDDPSAISVAFSCHFFERSPYFPPRLTMLAVALHSPREPAVYELP